MKLKDFFEVFKNSQLLIPITLFLIAFLSKLFFIGSRDICLDEPFTIFHAQMSTADIFKLPAQNEPNPPLFMLLLHFWIKLFGVSPYSVRILPLFFNALTVVYLYLAGKMVFSKWAGLLASAFFLLSTYHFYFGLETRAYSLLSCAAIASYYFFNLLVNNPTQIKYLVFLLISNIVLIYSHYFGWFVVFAQFLGSLFFIKQRKILIRFWLTLFLTGLAFIPMAIVFVKQFFKSSKGTWVQPPANSAFYHKLNYFLNEQLPTLTIIILIGLIILVVFKKMALTKIKSITILLIWWLVPYTIMFLVSEKIPMFIDRYILFNSIPLYLFLAALLYTIFSQIKYGLPIISAFIVILMFLKLDVNSDHFYYREVKNTINYVKNKVKKNSIIITHPHWTNLGFIYYYEPEIFKSVDNYDSLLKAHNIYPVWKLYHTKEAIKKNPDKRIIYYQDGSLFNDPNNTIFKYLDSAYHRIDSVFYPQCFYVSVFEPKAIETE